MPRRLVLVLASLVALGSLAAVAQGSDSAGRPAGSPDLAAMALATTDFPPGTRIDAQGYHRDPDYVASYERDYDIRGGRIGRSRILAAFESLDVERTPARAKSTFDLFATIFRGKQGAALLKVALVEEGIDPRDIAIGKIRRVAIGQGAIAIPLRVKEGGIAFDFTITFMRFDRLLVDVGLVAIPGSKLVASDVDRVSRAAIERTRGGLVPTALASPVISGAATPGQALTATRGTWTGDQLTYAFQWQRCGSTGGSCTEISGATSSSYSVAPGDLASTVGVVVVGKNRLGKVSSSSQPSGVVAGPAGSPTSTTSPQISGVPAVGATLIASTGSWSGDPTSFAYQWRWCAPSAADACTDIVGATGSTYVVSSADSRRVLRVLVVATNPAGPGGAFSAPTAEIP